jgi:hypothetical protein
LIEQRRHYQLGNVFIGGMLMASSEGDRYRIRAEDARRCAGDMADNQARQMMLRIAREYDELARRAEWLMTSRMADGRSEHLPHARSDTQPGEDVARPSASNVSGAVSEG